MIIIMKHGDGSIHCRLTYQLRFLDGDMVRWGRWGDVSEMVGTAKAFGDVKISLWKRFRYVSDVEHKSTINPTTQLGMLIFFFNNFKL